MRPHEMRPYLIVPRYLAGPDETGMRLLIEHLVLHGWHASTLGDVLVFGRRGEGGLLEALYNHASVLPTRGTCPAMGWEFTARPGPGQAATWTVRFDLLTPPELITSLATALTAPHKDHGPGDWLHHLRAPSLPGEAASPLERAGWMRETGSDECVWYARDQQAVVVTPLLTGQRGHGGVNWLFAARRAIDTTTLWHATAHPNTPTHLVHTLCAALTDPAPVRRQTCPGPETGRFTVTRT